MNSVHVFQMHFQQIVVRNVSVHTSDELLTKWSSILLQHTSFTPGCSSAMNCYGPFSSLANSIESHLTW